MGKRHTTRGTGRTAVAVAFAVSAALTLAGCGGGSEAKAPATGAASGSTAPGSGGSTAPGGSSSSAAPSPTRTLAQLTGEKGMVVTVTDAVRDSGGFVTVKGLITNNGTEAFSAVNWRGQEVALTRSGPSVAGAVLVDAVGKKRYYVLRDTEGKCLCTMGLIGIQPKETRPFFAQFPAPPASTTEVDFELPTMPPAKLRISGE